jgi:peptidoglycan/LPS O-acetylase OafA/YrhL
VPGWGDRAAPLAEGVHRDIGQYRGGHGSPATTAVPAHRPRVTSPSPAPGSHAAPTDQPSPARPGRKQPRLAALDGLRLLAALAVLGYHYTSFGREFWGLGSNPFPRLSSVFGYGWLGVNLFFLISGFVICMSSWGRGLGDFFTSRVTRLFPTYWFAILLSTAVLALGYGPLRKIRMSQLLANFTMMQEPLGVADVDGSYWTLWRELLFYLIFAVVVWRGVTYRRVVAFCALWTVASMVVATEQDSLLGTVVDAHFSMYFIAGTAMNLMHRFGPTLLLWGLVICSWALALHKLGQHGEHTFYLNFERGEVNWWVAAGLVTLFFLVILAIALGFLDRVRGRWLSVAGALTYPLYLLHQSIGYAVIGAFGRVVDRHVLLAGLGAGMLVLAWLTHRFVERPAAPRLRRHLQHAFAQLRTDRHQPAGDGRSAGGRA